MNRPEAERQPYEHFSLIVKEQIEKMLAYGQEDRTVM
jgi:hypothetical protein